MVRRWVDRGHDEPHWTAALQYSVGELGDEDARSIVSDETSELIESGAERNPLEAACEERTHDVLIENRREYPLHAITRTCDRSRDTIEQLLGHDVPSVRHDCGRITSETEDSHEKPDEFEDADVLCTDCPT